MTYYLDASALVKRYVEERGSDAVSDLINQNPLIVTAGIAYTEIVTGLRRKRTEREISVADYERLLDQVTDDWTRLQTIPISEALHVRVRQMAAELSGDRYLRALDAIHLATVLTLMSDGGDDLRLVTSDVRLKNAAQDLGVTVLDPEQPQAA